MFLMSSAFGEEGCKWRNKLNLKNPDMKEKYVKKIANKLTLQNVKQVKESKHRRYNVIYSLYKMG